MGPITFSGLASGLDSSSIIDQLVALERAPAQTLEARKGDLNSHKSIVSGLVSRFKSLSEVADGLLEPTEIRAASASSSNEEQIGVSVSGSALPGTYSIRVNQLASGETSSSSAFGTADAGVVGTGDVTITVGTEAPITINYTASDSLYDIAARINDSEANVSASVLFDGSQYRLMVSSNETGADSAISFSETGSALGLALPGSELVSAQNAEIEMNTITIQRSTNTFSDVLDGVTLNVLKESQVSDPDTVVTIARDIDGQRAKIQGFVDAFNSVVDSLNAQLTYNGVDRGTDTLFGDGTLQGLQRRLSATVTNTYTHNSGTISLGELGIRLDATGKLSIDSTVFDAAVNGDPEALENLFAGDGADGIAQTFVDMVEQYTRSGDGIFTVKTDGIDDRIDALDDQIQNIEDSAAALGDRLLRQFTALEEIMATLTSQQSFLSQAFV